MCKLKKYGPPLENVKFPNSNYLIYDENNWNTYSTATKTIFYLSLLLKNIILMQLAPWAVRAVLSFISPRKSVLEL